MPGRRSEPMPVKPWSFAGLILTHWCNARCASCYLFGSPEDRPECPDMPTGMALEIWGGLARAAPNGCRIHLTGGEPFGRWECLLAVCRGARERGLAPVHKVETNAFWAVDEKVIVERLEALDACGLGRLVISADPYHQQFVPIERCRLLRSLSERVLGARRVQVRWLDWLGEGFDTSAMDERSRAELFARYAAGGRDRLNGRAATELGPLLPRAAPDAMAGQACAEALLRSRHVHVDGQGLVIPGTCAGLVLGRVRGGEAGELWRRLRDDYADRPVIGTLARGGPFELLRLAEELGVAVDVAGGFASKCHLCRRVRQALAGADKFGDEIGPRWMYAS